MDKNRMSLREGKVYLDGDMVMDSVKLEIIFTPETAESRAIGQRGKSRRWIGFDITGSMTEYKSSPWLKKAAKKYIETGRTPKYTVIGVQDDPVSDYGNTFGKDIATVENVVITSDISLIQLDSEGEHVTCDIEFGAENVIIN